MWDIMDGILEILFWMKKASPKRLLDDTNLGYTFHTDKTKNIAELYIHKWQHY